MQVPHSDSDKICPFRHQQMQTVCHTCPLWVQVQGTNPNTGEFVSRWDCSFAWLPMLLIENSQQQRQTGAAVESFRNEMVNVERRKLGAAIEALHPLIEASR